MKKILCFFAVIGLFWGCASSKSKKDVAKIKLQTIPVLKNYNEDLSLKIEQFPDSQVQVTNDVNQEINLSTKFSSGTTVYRITFEKEATQYQDDFYKEEIWIALPSTIQNNAELIPALEKATWYFGRFCYCKGLAGYSEIFDKKTVLNTDNTIEISFSPFKGETKIQKIQWVFAKK
jgi:hypothetical protein